MNQKIVYKIIILAITANSLQSASRQQPKQQRPSPADLTAFPGLPDPNAPKYPVIASATKPQASTNAAATPTPPHAQLEALAPNMDCGWVEDLQAPQVMASSTAQPVDLNAQNDLGNSYATATLDPSKQDKAMSSAIWNPYKKGIFETYLAYIMRLIDACALGVVINNPKETESSIMEHAARGFKEATETLASLIQKQAQETDDFIKSDEQAVRSFLLKQKRNWIDFQSKQRQDLQKAFADVEIMLNVFIVFDKAKGCLTPKVTKEHSEIFNKLSKELNKQEKILSAYQAESTKNTLAEINQYLDRAYIELNARNEAVNRHYELLRKAGALKPCLLEKDPTEK